jgi:hypothetical protein
LNQNDRLPLEGGCLCGRVRYRQSGPLLSVDYCHCRMCQRATGAPATAWATGDADGFAWIAGTPTAYASSALGRRWFCPDCGTPLAFQEMGETPSWGVTLGSLDDPAALVPRQHAWIGGRIPWHVIDETLPAFVDEGPESERPA